MKLYGTTSYKHLLDFSQFEINILNVSAMPSAIERVCLFFMNIKVLLIERTN